MSDKKEDLIKLGRFLEGKLGKLSKEQSKIILDTIGKSSYKEIFAKTRKNCVLVDLIQLFRVWNVQRTLYENSNEENNFVLLLRQGFHYTKSYTVKNTITDKTKVFEALQDIENDIDNIIKSLKDDSIILENPYTNNDIGRFRINRKYELEGAAVEKLLKHDELYSSCRADSKVFLYINSLDEIKIGIGIKGQPEKTIKKWYIRSLKDMHRSMYLIGTIKDFLKDQDIFTEYRDCLDQKDTNIRGILEKTKTDNSIYRMYARPTCYGRRVKYSIRVMVSASNIVGLFNEI